MRKFLHGFLLWHGGVALLILWFIGLLYWMIILPPRPVSHMATPGILVTPAMSAGIADKLMTMEDVLAICDQWEAAQPRKRPGRKPKAESN